MAGLFFRNKTQNFDWSSARTTLDFVLTSLGEECQIMTLSTVHGNFRIEFDKALGQLIVSRTDIIWRHPFCVSKGCKSLPVNFGLSCKDHIDGMNPPSAQQHDVISIEDSSSSAKTATQESTSSQRSSSDTDFQNTVHYQKFKVGQGLKSAVCKRKAKNVRKATNVPAVVYAHCSTKQPNKGANVIKSVKRGLHETSNTPAASIMPADARSPNPEAAVPSTNVASFTHPSRESDRNTKLDLLPDLDFRSLLGFDICLDPEIEMAQTDGRVAVTEAEDQHQIPSDNVQGSTEHANASGEDSSSSSDNSIVFVKTVVPDANPDATSRLIRTSINFTEYASRLGLL